MSSKKIRSPKRVVLTVLIAIVAFLLLYTLLCYSTPIFYSDFMGNSEKLGNIPGLSEGFIPQGLCYSETLDAYLCCGYFSDSPSRIYVIGKDGNVKSLELQRENGEPYKGHAGGISTSGEHVWISNQKKAFHLTTDVIKNASSGDTVAFDGYFDVGVNASFTFSDEELFWIGEYANGDSYKTRDENHFVATDGENHSAMIYGYLRDDSKPFGVDTEKPVVALSVRDIVQGFCVTSSGKCVLSTSAGLKNSHLYIYDLSDSETSQYTEYNGEKVPLYFLDSNTLENVVTMPHMSEDLDYEDGMVLVGFEAGAKKYGAGLLPFSLRSFRGYKLD